LFLRSHDRQSTGVIVKAVDHTVSQVIQLHHLFSLDIGRTGFTQDFYQTSARGLAGDDFPCQGNVVEQTGQNSCRFWMTVLLFEYVSLDCVDLILIDRLIEH
jgi:hypothetical protein